MSDDRIDLILHLVQKQGASFESFRSEFQEFRLQNEKRLTRVEERTDTNSGRIKTLITAVITLMIGLIIAAFKAVF